MKKIVRILILSSFLYSPIGFSWNALGHRLIMQIAYDHLTPHAKVTFNRYNRAVDSDKVSLVNSAVWLDNIRAKTHAYDAMHYIDIPFSDDHSSLPVLPRITAVWAVNKAIAVLLNPNLDAHTKGTAVRMLVHVVGDIHQPLHAATRISWQYPEGDRGGNLVKLYKNAVARNLHSYWDKGAGLLVGKRRYGNAWVKARAYKIEQKWPCNMIGIDLDAMHWAAESNEIAQRVVYQLPHQNRTNARYQHAAQYLVEQRIALSGCRLAALMNHTDQAFSNAAIMAPKNRVASPPVTAR